MGSRDSWIDPDEVSDLAGEIFPQQKKPGASGEGDEFLPLPLSADDAPKHPDSTEGGDDDEIGTAERIGERLRAIRERAVRSGLLVGTEPEHAAEVGADADAGGSEPGTRLRPFVAPSGRLGEKVSALAGWLAEGGEFERIFLLDELGDELVPGAVPAGLRSGAVRLAQSWERSQGWLREDGQAAEAAVAGAALAGGQVLSVVGARCPSGFYCAAMVGGRMVSPAVAARVREALLLVFG